MRRFQRVPSIYVSLNSNVDVLKKGYVLSTHILGQCKGLYKGVVYHVLYTN